MKGIVKSTPPCFLTRDRYQQESLHHSRPTPERSGIEEAGYPDSLSHIFTSGTKWEPPILDYYPVINETVRNLEEESDKLNGSPDVLSITGTDCQKYQHQATQEKTNSENTRVGAELTVNIAEKIISSNESNRSSSRTKKIPTKRSHYFLWET